MPAFVTAWAFTGGELGATSSDGVNGAMGGSVGVRSVQTGLGYPTGAVLQAQQTSASHTSAANTGSYQAFTLTPDAQTVDWTPELLQFLIARGGSSAPRGVAVRTSADGYTSTLLSADTGSVRPTWSNRSVDLTGLGKLNGPLTIRLYLYGPTTTATQEIDSVTITGQRTIPTSTGPTTTLPGTAMLVPMASTATLADDGLRTATLAAAAVGSAVLAGDGRSTATLTT